MFCAAAAEAFDGLEYTVDFKDGEAYKIIHVKITDDDVYEMQEAFGLSLYNLTNGAEIGEQNSSSIIIDDNEKVEKCNIGFALENYQVFSDADGVTVTLKREGNVNDYVSVYVSTLADSAKADEDYTPVMGDMMFLPGETVKKVYVPLLKDNISEKELTESLYFDITAETEDNANITVEKTRVEILPFTNTDNKALVNVDQNGSVAAYSAEDAPVEAYEASGSSFTVLDDHTMTLSESGFPHYYETTWKSAWWRVNDLTGVEHVEWEWKNPVSNSVSNDRQISYMGFNTYEKKKYKGWSNWEKGQLSASDMVSHKLRTTDVKCWIGVYRDWVNPMDTSIRNIRAYYTNFKFISKGPDKMKAKIYNGTGAANEVSTIEFSPSKITG